ncbi:DUF1206 domain-containing protein [Phenylobacterium sp.]|uniref:DUF1206 domain-containing protein n=1 Tax=Phenylobacterium sp. TaxID=1871053 RepID=UPI002E355B3A|nr:DUF1206 domain-containing protein [Phenylobacterium sp.]HEX2561055.1 DUF1206 domain-containing protein [Phenylobacterium sp.]
MTDRTHPSLKAWRETRAWLAQAPLGALAELACRAGFVSRGLVYLSVGVIALLAAAGHVPRAAGAVEALQAWGEWPAGRLLLWLTGLGMYGFAGWRLLQSLFDADREGSSPGALANRAGQAISGVVHAALGFAVFSLIDALGEAREVDDLAATKQAVQQVLDWPGGALAIAACGLFIVAVGMGNLVQAAGKPHRRLVCTRGIAKLAAGLGRLGHLGRGVAFLPLGLAMFQAGQQASSGPARGLGGALDALRAYPFGEGLLALAGVGLIAFGLFAFLEARYRTLGAAEVVDAMGSPAPA